MLTTRRRAAAARAASNFTTQSLCEPLNYGSVMKYYIVRYGAMRALGVAEVRDTEKTTFFHGARVVVKSPRGQELATILRAVEQEELAALTNLGKDRLSFVRRANHKDFDVVERNRTLERPDFARCQKIITRMKIDMQLVRVERILGGERVVVYYVADGRVDFRELVRALAAEFQTRVEMRQIGVRDETKLLADAGDCGREVCCNSFLAVMPPVSMKMAKLQKATLDPTKVSGRCGRLKCCLRFEYDYYHELQETTPAIGRVVSTPSGRGRVIAQELLAQRVVVEFEDGGRQGFTVDELIPQRPKPEKNKRAKRDAKKKG